MITKQANEIVPGHEIIPSEDDDMVLIGGFEPIRVEHQIIDSLEASRLLQEWNNMPGQRKIDEKRVVEYMERIDQGLWHGCEVAVALLVDEQGRMVPDKNDPTRQTAYIINGQHSLTALSRKMAKAQVIFKFYEVTRRNMEMLYAQFDDHKTKTGKVGLEPLAHMFGYKPPSKKDQKKLLVPSKIVDLVGRSIFWVDYRGMRIKADRPANHRIIGIIRDCDQFIQWLINLHQDPTNPFGKDEDKSSTSWMWRQGIVAAMYKTWSVNRDLATSFWTRVLRPIEEGDPTGPPEAFRELLRNNKNGDWGNRSQSRLLKAAEMAWNAWREDEQGTLPAGIEPSRISTMDDGSLENLYFKDISENPDVVSTKINAGEDIIKKTGKLVK